MFLRWEIKLGYYFWIISWELLIISTIINGLFTVVHLASYFSVLWSVLRPACCHHKPHLHPPITYCDMLSVKTRFGLSLLNIWQHHVKPSGIWVVPRVILLLFLMANRLSLIKDSMFGLLYQYFLYFYYFFLYVCVSKLKNSVHIYSLYFFLSNVISFLLLPWVNDQVCVMTSLR